jgi:transcriptional regulator with XRE-family HTH domain
MVTLSALLLFAVAGVVIAMDTLAVRVGQRIGALIGQSYGRQREVARSCGKSDAWLSNIVNGHSKIRLDDLEQIAIALGVSVADLVDDQPRTLMRLDLDEQDFIAWYRRMPEKVQRHWLHFLRWAVTHK